MGLREQDRERPGRRDRPRREPRRSYTGLVVVLVVVGGGVLSAGAVGAAGWWAWKRGEERVAAARAAAAAEREADRAEAAAAFADPAPPTPAEAAEFGRFLDALGADLRRADGPAVGRRFDTARMVAEMNRAGALGTAFAGNTRQARAEIAAEYGRTVGPALADDKGFRWDRAEVRRVRRAAGGREAVVIAVLSDSARPRAGGQKYRWWLAGGPGGWRAYDFENLDFGVRYTARLAEDYGPGADGLADPDKVAAADTAVTAAGDELAAGADPDKVEKTLAPARGLVLPPSVAASREITEGRLLVARGDPGAALARFDAADRVLPGIPVLRLHRAAALNQLGRHAEALEQARAYVRELGPDTYAHYHEGWALEKLGRAAEAAAAYGRALDDDPDGVTALHGLRRVLTGDKAELTARLAKAPKAAELYDGLVGDARDDGDGAGLKALAAGLAKAKPDDPRVAGDEVRGLVEAGKLPEAAAALKAKLDKAGPGKPAEELLDGYLFAMLRADKPLEAYAAVPPAFAGPAFRTLASDLDDELGEGEPDQPDPAAERLKELIAAHRTADPGDPWLWYYEGSLLQSAGKYAEAEKEYAAGAEAVERRVADGKPVGGFGDDPAADARGSFRGRRVACLYQLKKGLEAYERVGPAEPTFTQLAWLYHGANDPAGLDELTDAHEPNAVDDAPVRFWRGQAHYLRKDWPAAAAAYAAYRTAVAGREDEKFLARQAWDKQVRALVKAGELRDARAVVGERTGDDADPVLAAVVAAAAGDAAEVGRLLDAAAGDPGGVGRFYWDQDFAKLIAGPAFDAVRAKHPDPRPKPPPGPVG